MCGTRSGSISSPKNRRVGGAKKKDAGPIPAMMKDQNMAGFSFDAHRRYRNGCEKKRGPDIPDIAHTGVDLGGQSTEETLERAPMLSVEFSVSRKQLQLHAHERWRVI